jgi:hypothetical protein
MGGGNTVRSEHSPFCIVPHLGQVSENSLKPPKSEHWAVFHECEWWSYFAKYSVHFFPQTTSLSVKSVCFCCVCAANILARKPTRNHVNNSSPLFSVKCSHIIPNRERFEASVVLPCDKYIAGVFVELDCANRSPSEQFSAEYSTTSACEKSQLIHFFLSVPRTMRGSCGAYNARELAVFAYNLGEAAKCTRDTALF